MVEKKEYLEFKMLLMKTMRGMSQQAFADEVGLTKEHVNRMLKSTDISRPSKGTLIKILKHRVPDVSPLDLFLSCDYTKKDCQNALYSARLALPLGDRMVEMAKDFQCGFAQMLSRVTAYENIHALLRIYRKEYVQGVSAILFKDFGKCKDYSVEGWKTAYAMGLQILWTTSKDIKSYWKCCTYAILFYELTGDGRMIPVKAAFDMDTLLQFDLVSDIDLDMCYEDGVALQELPFYTSAVLCERDYKSEAGKILRNLLNMDENGESVDTDLWSVTFGMGSIWAETPKNFGTYVKENQMYFKHSEQEVEILNDLLDCEELTPAKIDGICEEYRYDIARGTVAVALAIANRRREAAFPDATWTITYGESEQYEDKLLPSIYVDEDEYCAYGKLDQMLMSIVRVFLSEECRAMGLPSFGTICVYRTLGVDLNHIGQEPFDEEDEDALVPDDLAFDKVKDKILPKGVLK